MRDEPQQRRPFLSRVMLPLWLGGYLIGMVVGLAYGNIGLGMSLGLAVGAMLALALGMLLHPEELPWRRSSRSGPK